jgi:hypothetical protein
MDVYEFCWQCRIYFDVNTGEFIRKEKWWLTVSCYWSWWRTGFQYGWEPKWKSFWHCLRDVIWHTMKPFESRYIYRRIKAQREAEAAKLEKPKL